MVSRLRAVALGALLVLILIVAACGAPAAPSQAVAPAPPAADGGQGAAPAQPEPAAVEAPAPPEAPAPESGVAEEAALMQDRPLSDTQAGVRKIIKDGELSLVVDDLVRAVDRITKIAVDPGGYVLSSELSTEAAVKTAVVKLGIPSEYFDDVMRQLRGIALTVRWERSSGKDVTEEYTDLQSQLTNLQATQARIRELLAEAETVEEALRVNAELTKIEGEIEQIQGRMNYLKDRAAYSSITLFLEQISPTPTVTPTPSVTPTPTSTPTPTPIVWHPGETFDTARISLQYVLRGLGDFSIWSAVICVPLAIVALIVLGPLWWLRRRLRGNRRPRTAPVPEAPAEKES